MARILTVCLTALLLVPLAAGCGSEADKKGINKNRDRPVPAPPRVEGERAGAPDAEPRPRRRNRE
jgi:hypothetical protein